MFFEDFIDFNILFITMCLLIFYRYVTKDNNIVLERKNKDSKNKNIKY